MGNELLVFSHNDLDMAGCVLNIEHKWPNIRKKYWHTNYTNIPQIVDEIIEYASKYDLEHLLIPDVSFSENKDSLKRLYNAIPHITLIDHHMYPDGYWDEFPNMKVVWDKTKCATTLCYEYFQNDNEKLRKLSKLIEIYDIWQEDHGAFQIAQDLNNYFWEAVNADYFINKFIQNGYDLPNDFNQVVQTFNTKWQKHLESLEKRNLIHRADDVAIAFTDEYFNQFNLSEMAKGYNIIIGARSWGLIQIRFNKNSAYTPEQKARWKYELCGNADNGHENTLTYRIQGSISFDVIMNEIQKIVKVIKG